MHRSTDSTSGWKLAGRVRALVFLLLAILFIPTAQAQQTVTLDWDDAANDWPQTSPPSNFTESYSVGAGTVTITFGGATDALINSTPEVRQSPTGGLNPVENSLAAQVDFPPGSSNAIPITIDFSHSGGVSNVVFSLFDVDANATLNPWDQVRVTATNGVSTFDPTAIVPGNPAPTVGNEVIPPNVLSGVTSVNSNASDGNGTFNFAQTGITRITVVYLYPGANPDPVSQQIALHDITFTEGGGSNMGPVAVDDEAVTGIDQPVGIDVLANDFDSDGGSVNLLSAPSTSAEGGAVAINDNGTPGNRTDDFIDYTPPAGFNDLDTFEYMIDDNNGLTDSATVTVDVVMDFQLDLDIRPDQPVTFVGDVVRWAVAARNRGLEDLDDVTVINELPPGFTYLEGSARVNGMPANPSGVQTLVFTGIDIPSRETAQLTYVLAVGAGVARGEYINRARAEFQAAPLGEPAQAAVVVGRDPDFEQTTIIGKVFHDRDGDGWQDRGEEGVPGARLITVEGLIVETDAYGRYHLADLDGGVLERGRNFILKVDAATLPAGSEFTTENPRVRRITQGTLNRFDFGVRLADGAVTCCKITEVKLGEIHFSASSDVVWPDFLPILEELSMRLQAHGGGVLTLEGMSDRRVKRVYETLRRMVGSDVLRGFEVRTTKLPEAGAEACTEELCRQPDGYQAELIVPGSSEDAAQVDVGGRFTLSLPRGGRVWLTEDPTVIDPRVAVSGPDRVPLMDGRFAEPATFHVYNNYARFMARAELVFYLAGDMDRIAPIATVPVPVEHFGAFEWDGPSDLPLTPGVQLDYQLRAYDEAGRVDETHFYSLQLVGDSFRTRPPRITPRRSVPPTEGPQTGSLPEATPLGGNQLILEPPTPYRSTAAERKLYTLRPEFRGDEPTLGDADTADLDRIADEVRTLSNLRVDVSGHTDNAGLSSAARRRFADNVELSQAWAVAVADYLEGMLDLRPGALRTSGKGSDEPVASNFTAEGRELNRRVELRISGDRVTEVIDGPADMKLVDPATGIRAGTARGLKDAEQRLRERVSSRQAVTAAGSAAPGAAPLQRNEDVLAAVYGRSDLVRQNIPVRGSRVRIYGRDVPPEFALEIEGLPVPVDPAGRFAVEYMLPVGKHDLAFEMRAGSGEATSRSLPVNVRGKHLSFIALADITAQGQDIKGNPVALSGDERYEEDFLAEGRLALYMKGKLKGKYRLTAQVDTTEEQLDEIFGNLGDTEPRDVFRRLDVDRFAPTYGDDSTTIADTNSQGRAYFRMDWDKSEALWGNYNTGITGTELGQYNRGLYGAKYRHRSMATTSRGEPRTEGDVFASEAQTALGHSEFLGTGGSLYYLRHRDILPGSDKARVEILERDTGRVIENITLIRGADYEVDEIQGRILLARPLQQVAQQYRPFLIRDQPLDGNKVVMLVDYEYVPDDLDPDNVTAGGRGKGWIGDHVALGGTYVREGRGEASDYQLAEADITLQAGKGTYLMLQYAQSEEDQTGRFFSDNGGLSFDRLNPLQEDREGDAYLIEARANFKELTGSRDEWIAAAWLRGADDGFSVARSDIGQEKTEYGAEFTGNVGRKLSLSGRASSAERGGNAEAQRISVQLDYRVIERGTLSAEVRQLRDKPATDTEFTSGTLGAVQYRHRLGASVGLYATGQFTLDDDDGRYEENNLATLGTQLQVGKRLALSGEINTGDRGDAALAALEYKLLENSELYGTFTRSIDRSDSPRTTNFAMGYRTRLSNQTTVFVENQFLHRDRQAGIAHVFGLDYVPRPGWNLGLWLQSGELESTSGLVDRDATTLVAGYRARKARWTTKLEYRKDEGAEQDEQWLTSNRVTWEISPSLRLNARLNLSNTEDTLTSTELAQFVESGLGIAYRPTRSDRWNMLFKYTFLYDLPSPGQTPSGTDQRSNVAALEGIFRASPRWEIGGKLAHRMSELRLDRAEGEWFDNSASLGTLRLSWHWIKKWDVLAEYRILDTSDVESSRSGFLVGVDRHLGSHFKVGVGYNFTDFSDDLTDLSYDFRGWFVNFVTKY